MEHNSCDGPCHPASCRKGAYRPENLGSRFCIMAAMPSLKSALRTDASYISSSWTSAWDRLASRLRCTRTLASPTDTVAAQANS